MKHRVQERLQVAFDHHLSDPVGNRWNAKRPGSSRIAFRYIYATHGWREVGAGTHPIPDPIQVLTQVPVEILDGLSIARRPSVCLHLLVRLPPRIRNVENDLALSMEVIPFQVVY